MRIALSLLVMLTLPLHAAAQTVAPRIGVGGSFETYSFADPDIIGIESLTLLSAPFAASIALGARAELSVSGAWARAELKRDGGSEATIAGPTDTEVRLTVRLANDVVRLSVVGLAPTGKSGLTIDEADVAGMIAADLLPFRVTSWGSGGGLGGSVAVAHRAGDVGYGGSIGYVVASEFEPIDGGFDYRPGNQLHVRAAVDRTIGTTAKASLQLTYEKYGADQADGANLFRSGDRLQAVASYAFALGSASNGIAYAGYLNRQEGLFDDDRFVVPAENLLFAGAGARLASGRNVFQPQLELRVLGGDEDAGKGYTAGAGISVELPAGNALLVPGARIRIGRVELRPGQESGFTGGELSFTVRF
jgi:hypothetical protein